MTCASPIHPQAGLPRFPLLYACLAVAVILGALTAEMKAASTTAPQSEVASILSGGESGYPPYCIVTPDNRADGFSVELLRAALKAVGHEVVFSTGSAWPELKQDLADGRIQVLPLMGRTPEREALFDFTFPYLTMHGSIVVRDDCTTIHTVSDLKDKQVAVLQGDNAEEYLRRAKLGANIITRTSFETALRELSSGQHDAVVIQKLLAFQLMQQAGLTNLMTVGPPLQDFTQSFCFAVRKGDAELLAALNEGLAIVIADGTFRALYTKWFSSLEALGHRKSRIIIGGDSDYPPYEYLDPNGEPAGFNVAITRAIARQMGLDIEIRLGPWSRIRQGLGSGTIDLVLGMFYSVERDQEFAFSPSYGEIQHTIVVREGTAVPTDIQDLADKSILVMAGDIMEDWAKAQGYGQQLVAVPSQEEALRLLAAGQYDCALVAKVPALYWITKNGWSNLRVSEQPVSSDEYCYAAPKGQEALLSHFSEGLAALKASGEYRRIQNEWLVPYEEAGMRWQTVVKYSLIVVLPLLGLLAASFLWSRSLQRQVAKRTQALQQEIADRSRAQAMLLESEEKFHALFEDAPLSYQSLDADGRFIEVNTAWLKLLGYSREEAIGKWFGDFLAPEFVPTFRERFPQFKAAGKINTEYQMLRKDGERCFVGFEGRIAHTADGGFKQTHCILQDITERKRAEAELHESEAELRAVLDATPFPVALADLECDKIKFWSRSALSLFGHVAATTSEWYQIAYPDPDYRREVLAQWEPALEKARLSGQPVNAGEFRVTCRDGSTRLCEFYATCLADSLIVTFNDITERKQAETALRASQQLIEGIINTIPVRVFWKDKNLAYLGCNTVFAEDAGVADPQEIIGKDDYMLAWHQEQAEAYRNDDREVIDTGCAKLLIEEPQTTSSGRNITLLTSKIPLRDAQGEISGMIGVYIDITERKRAEEELKNLRKAVEQSANIIVITDLRGKIEYVNPAFERTTGYTKAEVMGKNPRLLKSGKQNAAFYRQLWARIQSGKTWRGEFQNKRKDGSLYWESATISPVHNDKGEIVHFIGIKEDITERKEMDTKLIEALNQAEAGNRAKSDFIGIMSHELRTPLNGVLGSAELLSFSSLDQDQKSLLETVSQCGGHLLAIVTDILDFSSMEAGKLVCHVEPIAVTEVVEQATSAVQKSTADKALEFRCEISRNVPQQIAGDALRIRQILINLLANAIKFTSSGLVVLRVTPSAEGQFLNFSVEDTGIGMSSDTIKQLFRPFTQADSTMTRAFGGTGLGLTISKRLAEAMGGSITVTSILEKGSTFTFHFPLESALAGAGKMTDIPFPISDGGSHTSAQTQPGPAIQTNGTPTAGKLVLIVEDDLANSTLAGKMLKSLGYAAEFAADGVAAVQAFEQDKYFAILMDLVMPRLNGIEATKKIRKLEATAARQVPIIALTANVTPTDRELCHAAGMNDFLTKPFKRAELAAALASVTV